MADEDREQSEKIFFNVGPAIPVQLICLLLIVTIIVILIRDFEIFNTRKVKTELRIAPLIKFPTLLVVILSAACIVITGIISFTLLFADEWTQEVIDAIVELNIAADICYVVSKLCMQFAYVMRVKVVFEGSAHELSKGFVMAALIWMTILFLFSSLFGWDFFAPMFGEHGYMMFVLVVVLEIGLVLTLLGSFVKRLGTIILQQKTDQQRSIGLASMSNSPKTDSVELRHEHPETVCTASSDMVESETDKHITKELIEISMSATKANKSKRIAVHEVKDTLSDKQTKLLFVITRSIVLSAISLITSAAFNLWGVVTTLNPLAVPIYVTFILWALDCLMNCVCLYLNFTFANRVYHIFCVCFHRSCQSFVGCFAARRLIKDIKRDRLQMSL